MLRWQKRPPLSFNDTGAGKVSLLGVTQEALGCASCSAVPDKGCGLSGRCWAGTWDWVSEFRPCLRGWARLTA